MRIVVFSILFLIAAPLLVACDRGDRPTLAESIEAGAEALAETVEEVAEAEEAAGEAAGEAAAEAAEEEASGEPAEAAEGAAAEAGGQPMAMGHDHETIEVDESEIVAQPGASMGDAARCPVSGETFRVRETSPSAEHDGGTTYFCCGSCVRPFLRNPDQYLSAAE